MRKLLGLLAFVLVLGACSEPTGLYDDCTDDAAATCEGHPTSGS